MKKILIAGGAGFIGSHLCDALFAEGNELLIVDNFQTGSKENIEHLLNNPKVSLLEHDITLPISIEENIDEIYNLACPASPKAYQRDPIHTLSTNFLGTKNLLDLAKEKGAKFLLASTSEIYGDPLVHPQAEEYKGNVNPVGPRSCYDEGKRVAETLAYEYSKLFGVDAKIVRIFNTYGPRMDLNDGRVVSNFIRQSISEEPLTVYGSGKQTRSLCFVSDLVRGIKSMMETEGFLGPVNLGNPTEMTILEIADKVKALVPTKGEITFKDLPQDDPTQRCPDITLAKERLSWEPEVNLEEGLKIMIDDFKNRIR